MLDAVTTPVTVRPQGLPEEMRLLLDAYPRDSWAAYPGFHALPGVANSRSLIHCRQGYFGRFWNGVVPMGPLSPMRYPEAYEHPELAG